MSNLQLADTAARDAVGDRLLAAVRSCSTGLSRREVARRFNTRGGLAGHIEPLRRRGLIVQVVGERRDSLGRWRCATVICDVDNVPDDLVVRCGLSGSELKAMRNVAGLSQAAVGRLIGVSAVMIGHYEADPSVNRHRRIPNHRARELVEALYPTACQLRAFRESRGWSGRAMSAVAGLGKHELYDWELGRKRPPTDRWPAIARRLTQADRARRRAPIVEAKVAILEAVNAEPGQLGRTDLRRMHYLAPNAIPEMIRDRQIHERPRRTRQAGLAGRPTAAFFYPGPAPDDLPPGKTGDEFGAWCKGLLGQEIAEHAGVSPAAVSYWLRHGVAGWRVAQLESLVARHLTSAAAEEFERATRASTVARVIVRLLDHPMTWPEIVRRTKAQRQAGSVKAAIDTLMERREIHQEIIWRERDYAGGRRRRSTEVVFVRGAAPLEWQVSRTVEARDIRLIVERYGVSLQAIAKALGVARISVYHWLGGHRPIPIARQAQILREFPDRSPVPTLNGPALLSELAHTGCTKSAAARALNVTPRTVARWGIRGVPPRELVRVRQWLESRPDSRPTARVLAIIARNPGITSVDLRRCCKMDYPPYRSALEQLVADRRVRSRYDSSTGRRRKTWFVEEPTR